MKKVVETKIKALNDIDLSAACKYNLSTPVKSRKKIVCMHIAQT